MKEQISYKKIAEEVIKQNDMKIEIEREKFLNKREQQRKNEEPFLLVDDRELDNILEHNYDPDLDAEEFKNKTGNYESPYTNQGVLKQKPSYNQEELVKTIRGNTSMKKVLSEWKTEDDWKWMYEYSSELSQYEIAI